MDKRQEKRLHKIMRIHIEQADTDINGSLIDVSSGGMKVRILSRKQFLFNQNLFIKVLDSQKTYKVSCRVRWQKEDPIDHSHILGLQFSGLDSIFCHDILKLDLGSKSAPYRYAFGSKEKFLTEYRNNIKHGGFKLNLDSPLPPLHKCLFVELQIPDAPKPCLILGEVVAHVPGGVGLTIKNHVQFLKSLKSFEAKIS